MRLRSQSSIILSPTDKETFTYRRWDILIKSARKMGVPCLPVAVCHLENTTKKSIYDAVFLDRHRCNNPHYTDPLTRRKIVRIEYHFLKLSHFNQKHELVPCHDSILSQITCDNQIMKKIAFESNNYHSTEHSKRALCQYIFGVHLLKQSSNKFRVTNADKLQEAHRWLTCSAINGNQLAVRALKTIKDVFNLSS